MDLNESSNRILRREFQFTVAVHVMSHADVFKENHADYTKPLIRLNSNGARARPGCSVNLSIKI